ncbi:hypothetical protein HanXRQr2_Chr16g0760621 [Helianthus annuus]|uniref:Uncharacterized protein n=1 Tax=Helianthus annuus TaxID=4232 RepID=A0A9K3DUN1_HELAN|nr:hypothetical protein HanXRQr2_Chr16g0760621 [Helianthus annuus]KAJ0822170.1 hypothetical protein HanPSC8_Chr16g0728821 [Helianthus annuus]
MLRTSLNERPPGSIWETPGANAGVKIINICRCITLLTPSASFRIIKVNKSELGDY